MLGEVKGYHYESIIGFYQGDPEDNMRGLYLLFRKNDGGRYGKGAFPFLT